MKAVRLVLTACFMCFAVVTSVSAGEGAEAPILKSGIDLGYILADFRYNEPGIMKETGRLHGVTLRGTHHASNHLMWRAEVEYLGSGLEYDGQYQDGTPLTADTDDRLFQARGLVGYDFVFDGFAVTPFVGIGYRYWYDEILAVGGYEREIEYVYSPVGVEVASASGRWRYGVRGEYDVFWGGKVKSMLSQADSGFNNPKLDQNALEGYGTRAAAFVEYAFDSVCVIIEPYYRFWDIQDSDMGVLTKNGADIGRVYEPQNTTRIYGVSLMVGF